MIMITCIQCGATSYRSPSKVTKRPFCNMACYAKTRDKELIVRGKPYRILKGAERPAEWTQKQTEKVSGERNYAWMGEKVGYRGLHQWVRRLKGKPTRCSHCGKESDRPRVIQWANVDGKYRRNLDDFIALCASCHKYYDLSR